MLETFCDELVGAHEARDGERLHEAVGRLWEAAQRDVGPAELDAVLPRICGVLAELPAGPGGQLAVLTGALVELGADPAPLAAPLGEGLLDCLEAAAGFASIWRHVRGEDADLPDPEDPQATVESAMETLPNEEVGEPEVFEAVVAWVSLSAWVRASLTVLQHRAVRAALPRRAEIGAAVEALDGIREDLGWLVGLLAVLDDERIVVLHRETGRGYAVTIGGLGDNFQFHTLLAAALSGPADEGLLEGVRPEPEWIAAATDGPLEPPSGPVQGQFNLVDAAGTWIWNEGRPADIPLVDDTRVVVLDPPPYPRTWNIGRVYPMMAPHLVLDRVLPADEAAAWLSRVAPAGDAS